MGACTRGGIFILSCELERSMNMQRTFKGFGLLCLSVTVAGSMLFESLPAWASGVRDGLRVAAGEAYGSGDVRPLTSLIANTIDVILSFSGVVLVIMVTYAGFLYLSDTGDAAKVKKAKALLSSSIIGIVLVLTAFTISSFVFGRLAVIIYNS